MARYRRRTTVDAPIERVWSFHSGVSGLEAVTPGWMHLRVESVRGPEGEPDQATLAAGTTVELSIRPLDVGPRLTWTSRVVERVRQERLAWFRDVMVEGPLPRWRHTHRFLATGAGTVIEDDVDYRLPFLPGPLSALGHPGLEIVFAHRHRHTAALLEGE